MSTILVEPPSSAGRPRGEHSRVHEVPGSRVKLTDLEFAALGAFRVLRKSFGRVPTVRSVSARMGLPVAKDSHVTEILGRLREFGLEEIPPRKTRKDPEGRKGRSDAALGVAIEAAYAETDDRRDKRDDEERPWRAKPRAERPTMEILARRDAEARAELVRSWVKEFKAVMRRWAKEREAQLCPSS